MCLFINGKVGIENGQRNRFFFSSPETLSFLIWKRLEFLANVNTLWVFLY